MTNREKYPIGAQIIYKPSFGAVSAAQEDSGKVGEIIGANAHGDVYIHLPTSKKLRRKLMNGKYITWRTSWKNVVRAPIKNEQLLFSFMDE